MTIVWNDVPEYVVALQNENAQRDCAFFMQRERILTIDVLPFTPRHLLILEHIGSPFVSGGLRTKIEVARFLWVVSSRFSFCSTWNRYRLVRRCRKLDVYSAIDAIDRYLDDAFADSPGSDSPSGAPTDYSWAASIVDAIASEYGWPTDLTIGIPFKLLWQYLRCIRRRHDPNATFINRVDKVKREHWQKVSASALN